MVTKGSGGLRFSLLVSVALVAASIVITTPTSHIGEIRFLAPVHTAPGLNVPVIVQLFGPATFERLSGPVDLTLVHLDLPNAALLDPKRPPLEVSNAPANHQCTSGRAVNVILQIGAEQKPYAACSFELEELSRGDYVINLAPLGSLFSGSNDGAFLFEAQARNHDLTAARIVNLSPLPPPLETRGRAQTDLQRLHVSGNQDQELEVTVVGGACLPEAPCEVIFAAALGAEPRVTIESGPSVEVAPGCEHVLRDNPMDRLDSVTSVEGDSSTRTTQYVSCILVLYTQEASIGVSLISGEHMISREVRLPVVLGAPLVSLERNSDATLVIRAQMEGGDAVNRLIVDRFWGGAWIWRGQSEDAELSLPESNIDRQNASLNDLDDVIQVRHADLQTSEPVVRAVSGIGASTEAKWGLGTQEERVRLLPEATRGRVGAQFRSKSRAEQRLVIALMILMLGALLAAGSVYRALKRTYRTELPPEVLASQRRLGARTASLVVFCLYIAVALVLIVRASM